VNQRNSSFRAVLREANFFRLWIGQIISSIGDRFYQFALLGVVLGIHQTMGVGKESARVIFAGMLPGLLFAPWYGWAVDRFCRRSTMIFADIVRAALCFLLIYLWFGGHQRYWIYAVVFLMGGMNGLFIPARQAALPQLIRDDRLITANALIALIGVIASLVGSLFAGMTVSIFGARSSFYITAAGFIASAWFIYRIDSPLRPDPRPNGVPLQQNWKELTAGWNILRGAPELLWLVLLNGLFAFTSGIFVITVLEHTVRSVDLTLVHQITDWLIRVLTPISPKPPRFDNMMVLGFGILFACVGIGLSLGVWFCGKSKAWSHWKGLPYFALIFLGIGMVGFAHIATYGPALLGCLGLGFFASIIAIPIDARLQHEVGDLHRGRVFALRNMVTTLSFLIALGINLDGRIIQWRGPTQLIQDLGLIVTLVSIGLVLLQGRPLFGFWFVQRDVASR
jgi:MFS family permease